MGQARPRRSSNAPETAPANINPTDDKRRTTRGFFPPANDESAARPVNVRVSTVVVMSATASFRTDALWIPIAKAKSAISTGALGPALPAPQASAEVAARSATSIASALVKDPPRNAQRPPASAPRRKDPRASKQPAAEAPPAWAREKPRKTTFPVMFAVNTRPSPRTLAASTSPVANVSSASAENSRRSSLRSPAGSAIARAYTAPTTTPIGVATEVVAPRRSLTLALPSVTFVAEEDCPASASDAERARDQWAASLSERVRTDSTHTTESPRLVPSIADGGAYPA